MKPLRTCAIPLCAVVGISSALACAARSGPPATMAVPAFDYTPPSDTSPSSAEVTLAIVAPSWGKEFRDARERGDWVELPVYSRFASAMEADFLELLTAKGFAVRGPFESYELMPFPDKEGSDLALMPELGVAVEIGSIARDKTNIWNDSFTMKGSMTISGRVTLRVTESITNQLMWSKSISVPRTDVPWNGTVSNPKDADSEAVLRNVVHDPAMHDAVTRGLSRLYPSILTTAWQYMDPREMQLLKKQAAELKKRWVR